mmetsp:Transcript_32543/g.75917  ORF Transcript_32543/g.75917 Transcript_32543/m.75917 type:complete len:891 (-) Transcript_32543:1244-3916(-)
MEDGANLSVVVFLDEPHLSQRGHARRPFRRLRASLLFLWRGRGRRVVFGCEGGAALPLCEVRGAPLVAPRLGPRHRSRPSQPCDAQLVARRPVHRVDDVDEALEVEQVVVHGDDLVANLELPRDGTVGLDLDHGVHRVNAEAEPARLWLARDDDVKLLDAPRRRAHLRAQLLRSLAARRLGLARHARVADDEVVPLLRDDDVLEHLARQHLAVHGDDLVAVLQLALRVHRAAGLDLDDDVVEGEADAQPVLLPLEGDGELVRFLDLPLGCRRRPAEHLVEQTLLLLAVVLLAAESLLAVGHRRLAGGRFLLLGRLARRLLPLGVHGVVLRLHLEVELLVVVVERVLVERHACGGVVVVDASFGVEPLLPALRLRRLQRLVSDPQQVRILFDVHAQILCILEHVRDGTLEVVLRPDVFLRLRLARALPSNVGDHRHVHHLRVRYLPVIDLLMEVVELLRVGLPVCERGGADGGEGGGLLLLGLLVSLLGLLLLSLLAARAPLEGELPRALEALLPVLLLPLLLLRLLLLALRLLRELRRHARLFGLAQLLLLFVPLALLLHTLGLLREPLLLAQLMRLLLRQIPPRARLHGDDVLRDVLHPLLLELIERANAEEDLGLAHTEARRVDPRVLEQFLDAFGASPGASLGHDQLEAREHLLELEMVGEALPRGLDGTDDAARVELPQHHIVDELVRLLGHVGLDTANEVRLCPLERVHELDERLAEGVDDADELGRLETADSAATMDLGLRLLLEERRDEIVVRELHEHGQILRERVLVLLEEAARIVGDFSGVVVDGEEVWVHPLLGEAVVLLVRLLELSDVRRIGTVGEETLLREQRQHAVLLVLDQIHHLRVVDVLHVGDVDPLLAVLGENRFEDSLGEHALQLLVCEIDA